MDAAPQITCSHAHQFKEAIMSRAISSCVVSLLATLSAVRAPAENAISQSNPSTQTDRSFNEQFICRKVLEGELFMRTELVFGMSRAGGPDITEAEFQSFVDDQVTPRFPDGLTVLSGNGQFRDSSGTIVQEKSKLLILLYPFTRASSKKVDEIRSEYQAMFQQQSVLRVDEEQCVSF
jgi:hypothetical protein